MSNLYHAGTEDLNSMYCGANSQILTQWFLAHSSISTEEESLYLSNKCCKNILVVLV